MKRTVKTGPKRRRYKRRDGNEKVRKGLGCTNRSVRLDGYAMSGPHAYINVKLRRSMPLEG